jgi:hypothetical protein
MKLLWHNVRNAPQRWAAYWLRRRGWIVFYLDPQVRRDSRCKNPWCWLNLYEDAEARG